MAIMGRRPLGNAPDVLGGVQVRRVWWEEQKFNSFRIGFDPVANEDRVMISSIVEDQEDLAVAIVGNHSLDES